MLTIVLFMASFTDTDCMRIEVVVLLKTGGETEVVETNDPIAALLL